MQNRCHRLSRFRSHPSPTPLVSRGSTQKPIPLVSLDFRTCPYARAGLADRLCLCSSLAGRNDHSLPQIRVSLRKPQAPALEFPPQTPFDLRTRLCLLTFLSPHPPRFARPMALAPSLSPHRK